MGKLEALALDFQSSNGVVYPGEVLSGTVHVAVRSGHILVRSLNIYLIGEAKTEWINKASDKIFESRETLLNLNLSLNCGKNDSDDTSNGCLMEGDHSIPFTQALPKDLLPSFEGEFGYIRYVCRASMQLPTSLGCVGGTTLQEQKVDRSFNVVTAHQPNLKRTDTAVTKDEEIEFLGCFGLEGRLEVTMHLAKTQFLVGDKIPLEIRMLNNSSKKLKGRGANLYLMQQSHFEALSKYESVGDSKDVDRVIEKLTTSEVIGAGETRTWYPNLVIADVTPTFDSACIKANYYIKLSINRVDITAPIDISWPKRHH